MAQAGLNQGFFGLIALFGSAIVRPWQDKNEFRLMAEFTM